MMSEEKAKEDMLLWMDVETTGLDPDRDRILEVEMRCTDMRGVRCVGGFRRVIGLKGRKASITDGNLEAWRMHCANGLLEGALDAGYTEAATANALEEYVDSLARSFILHPAAAASPKPTRTSSSTAGSNSSDIWTAPPASASKAYAWTSSTTIRTHVPTA